MATTARSENPSKDEAKASALQSRQEQRVFTEVYGLDVEHTVICGKCVLRQLGARYALRGFEEDVKHDHVIAGTTLTTTVRLLQLGKNLWTTC